jgi:tocopherol O-methyltransferase
MIIPRQAQSAAAVAAHYDELDPFYREIWGEHVHHGLWSPGLSPQEAADALVDLVAARLDLRPGLALCDIGCGYGATASRLVRQHGVTVSGVTLSAVQASRADGAANIRVCDWLANDFADASFDRAYAIESSEHMADKQRFFTEAFRTLRPGGRLVICAWLARPAPSPWEVTHLLEPICREGRLPGLASETEYHAFAQNAGFTCTGAEQLGRRVRHTWFVCAHRLVGRLLTDRRYRRFLFDGRNTNRVFALTILRLLVALYTGAMQYAVLVYTRPADAS